MTRNKGKGENTNLSDRVFPRWIGLFKGRTAEWIEVVPRRETVFFLACVLFATLSFGETAPTTAPDTLRFNTGDMLTGTVQWADCYSITFTNSALGTLTVKWSDVQSLAIDRAVSIIGGKPPAEHAFSHFKITVASAMPDHLNVEVDEGNTTVLLDQLQSIVLPANASEVKLGWNPTVNVNAAFVASTQRQQTYGGGLTLSRAWPHQRTLIDLQAKYDDKRKNDLPGSATITEYDIGHFQHMFFLTSSNKYYVDPIVDLVRNNSLGLFFQQSYGAGAGALIGRLELDADLRFIGQHFYGPNSSTGLAASQLSERYDLPLSLRKKPCDKSTAGGPSLTETFSFVPVFNASRAWQMRGVVELTVPVSAKFSFTTKLEDYYVENAPTPFRKNYLNTSIGLKFSPRGKP
jgi:hypothetical protein